jgi:uncharacterized membrane protein
LTIPIDRIALIVVLTVVIIVVVYFLRLGRFKRPKREEKSIEGEPAGATVSRTLSLNGNTKESFNQRRQRSTNGFEVE